MKTLQKITSLLWKYRSKAKLALTPDEERLRIIREFHQLYYELGPQGLTWGDTKWFGIRAGKCPLDLWLYQEILFELKPDLIIETGTAEGGSAHFFAAMCDLLGKGKIISVDIAPVATPPHPRVTYLKGSSTAPEIISQIDSSRASAKVCLVVLDSDHSKSHVLEELKLYHRFVTQGSYLIVEDTNVNGHPVFPEHGPGPMEALDEFLRENPNFQIDESKHKLLLSFNPRGYLKKISG